MRTFLEIASEHETDKVSVHAYQDVYPRYLEQLRESEFTLLEIGVDEGKSLRMWRDYFPRATVIGIDREEASAKKAEGVLVMDVRSPKFESWAKEAAPFFHVIVDDGGHWPMEQNRAFDLLWPKLAVGGWYFVEDLHVKRKNDFAGRAGEFCANLMRNVSFCSEIHVHPEICALRKAW